MKGTPATAVAKPTNQQSRGDAHQAGKQQLLLSSGSLSLTFSHLLLLSPSRPTVRSGRRRRAVCRDERDPAMNPPDRRDTAPRA